MRAMLILLVAGCTGPDYGVQTLVPGLAVAPDRLAFGEVGPPLSATQQVFVTNSGKADLEVAASITGDAAFVLEPQGDFVLKPGEEVALDVTFSPETFKQYTGRVRIDSNDQTNPFAVVALTGEGVDLPFPDIHIYPSQTVEVLDVGVGGSDYLAFEIENRGESPLELGELVLEGPPSFTLATDVSSYTIAAGNTQPVLVEYVAPHDEGEEASLVIPSNDPDEPEVDVVLLANGGGERPVAVIDCPTEVLLTGPEVVQFDGSGSYDPRNLNPLSYHWEVTGRPDASDPGVRIDPDNLEQADIYVDVGGTWEVSLQVFNVLGTPSDVAVCQFGAVPQDDLHVELSWDTSAADMDLHLARGGAGLFQSPDDCNYCNTNPDWGTNAATDDPRLDLDDQGGIGPENINIESPEDGTYDVRVHYFKRNGDGPVIATVRVWTLGAEVWTGQQVMQHDEVWDVGTVSMPTGSFVPGVAPLYAAPLRDCTD